MKTFGGSFTEYGHDIVQRKQGGYFICGETHTPAFVFSGCENYFVSTDIFGALIGSFSSGGSSCDVLTCMRALPDSGFVVAGKTLSYGLVENDIQIIRFDKNNNIVWSKRVGGANFDQAYGIALTHDGGFAVAGIYSVTSSDANRYVAKLDANGNLVWTCVFGDTSFERLNSIERTSDNGFIVCGISSGPPAVAVSKISAAGVLQWNTIIKGTTNEQANHAIETYDGGYAVTGYSYSYSVGSADIMLCKLNASGNLLWYKCYGNTMYNDGVDLVQTPDSGLVLACNTWNGFFVNDNIIVMKTDKNGNFLYAHEYGESTRLERATAMDTTTDGGFVITGSMFGCPSTNYEALVLKTLANGSCPSCDSNMVTLTTTVAAPTVLIGSNSYSSAGVINAITPMKKNVSSNMTNCSSPQPLPINLISFDGKYLDKKNILNWSTLDEHDMDYFTILKSDNGFDFNAIANVNSKGNSSQITNYSYVDELPYTGANYYKLQQTDLFGQSTFSKIINIYNSTDELNELVIMPNPATDVIHLSYSNLETNFEVDILSTLGETLIRKQNESEINVSILLPGVYFVFCKVNDTVITKHFIKL